MRAETEVKGLATENLDFHMGESVFLLSLGLTPLKILIVNYLIETSIWKVLNQNGEAIYTAILLGALENISAVSQRVFDLRSVLTFRWVPGNDEALFSDVMEN